MNKQSLRKTGFFLKGKGNYMNRTSKMVTLFQEKILLRKNVDYQEECLLRMIKYKLFSKKGLLRKGQLIHIGKDVFKDRTFSK